MVGTNTKAMQKIISFLHFIKSFRHISIRWRYSPMETCMWGSCKGNPNPPKKVLISCSTSNFGTWNLWWTPCFCFSKSALLPKSFLLFYPQLDTSPGKVSRLCTWHSSGTVAALMIKWWLCWRHPKLGSMEVRFDEALRLEHVIEITKSKVYLGGFILFAEDSHFD